MATCCWRRRCCQWLPSRLPAWPPGESQHIGPRRTGWRQCGELLRCSPPVRPASAPGPASQKGYANATGNHGEWRVSLPPLPGHQDYLNSLGLTWNGILLLLSVLLLLLFSRQYHIKRATITIENSSYYYYCLAGRYYHRLVALLPQQVAPLLLLLLVLLGSYQHSTLISSYVTCARVEAATRPQVGLHASSHRKCCHLSCDSLASRPGPFCLVLQHPHSRDN